MKRKQKKHNRSGCDYHHIFFQKRYWQSGYAKALRNCEYGGKKIPRDTVHQEIHRRLNTVPVPKGASCKQAFEAMAEARRNGWIDPENDSLEVMIGFYINIWKETEPETARALQKQLEVIQSYRGF